LETKPDYKLRLHVSAFTVISLFIATHKPLYNIDFWYDEIYSLEHFIQVPLAKTVTDYPAPNNHIFFNLLMNLWLRLWGIKDFAQAANSIWIVRLLPVLFSAGTLYAVYATVRKLGGRIPAIIGFVVLLCTIPFYNFMAQVRGYGLSMLLAAILTYLTLDFYNRKKAVTGLLITVCSTLFLYTIPSNLYGLLAFCAVAFINIIGVWGRQGFKPAILSIYAKAIYWVVAGVAFAVLLYLPVAKQVANNDYVKSEGPFRWEIWGEALIFFKHLLMPYYLPLFIIVPGLVFSIAKKRDTGLIAALAAIMLLPFVFSFIRGDKPFDRIFLWMLPMFAVWVSILYTHLHAYVFKGKDWEDVYIGLTILMLFANFHVGNARINNRLEANLNNNIKAQDIYYNYYLAHYHPHKRLGYFKEHGYSDSTPVYLHEIDKYSMRGYLPVHKINWEPFSEKIKAVSKYYIITAFPQKAETDFATHDSTFRFSSLNPQWEIDFVNILVAERK